jgi:hypothetical protein
MATVNFTYDYPYAGYGEDGRFQYQWSESRTTLNRCYTYPLLFNTAVPGCSHITMDIEIENTGSGTVLGRSWDFYIYRQNYGWYEVCSFTLPDDGKYTIDTDISNYTITQLACVPSSNPGSSRTWSTWYNIKKLTITENITLSELDNDKYFYGVFPNHYGIEKRPSEVFVNIDGTLKKATAVYANVEGSPASVPTLLSSEIKTDSETMKLYKFTPTIDGNYTIKVNRKSGDHEIRLYDSDFKPMTDSYFYERSLALTAGSVFYISVTHYYGADASESTLQIFKED